MVARNLVVFVMATVFLLGCSNGQVSKNSPDMKLAFDGKAPFVDAGSIKKEVKEQCDLNKNLASAITERAAAHGISLTQTENKRRLSVEIARATPGAFVFGNMGSIPAVLNVNFKVTEGEKVILEKRKNCSTKLAGFMGLAPSACNKLNKCAEIQAEFIATTLKQLP